MEFRVHLHTYGAPIDCIEAVVAANNPDDAEAVVKESYPKCEIVRTTPGNEAFVEAHKYVNMVLERAPELFKFNKELGDSIKLSLHEFFAVAYDKGAASERAKNGGGLTDLIAVLVGKRPEPEKPRDFVPGDTVQQKDTNNTWRTVGKFLRYGQSKRSAFIAFTLGDGSFSVEAGVAVDSIRLAQ